MKNNWIIIGIFAVFGLFGSCGNNSKENGIAKPVFDLHIEPIITENCAPCHRENGGAPFVLTSYENVRKKAKTIAKVTALRYMPPWPADPSYSHFIGEKRLTESQIQTIQNWVEQGCAPGKNPNSITLKSKALRKCTRIRPIM